MQLTALKSIKLAVVLIIMLTIVSFSFTSVDINKSVPTLTVTHIFQSCPFKIDLPGRTSSASRRNRETAEFLNEEFWISAGCSSYRAENDSIHSPNDIAKDFLARRMGLRIYKSYRIIPLRLRSNSAQLRYEAETVINNTSRTAYGIIYVKENFVLDIEVVDRTGNIAVDSLIPLFESAEYSTSI